MEIKLTPHAPPRCYLREWVCSMAWRFHAIDAMLSTELRLLDESRVASLASTAHTGPPDKDQQIDNNRKKAVE